MKMDALVSIVTPNYNGGRFLRATIESVLKQSFQAWEWIIVDDCSTDNSLEIINAYVVQDARIKVVSLQG